MAINLPQFENPFIRRIVAGGVIPAEQVTAQLLALLPDGKRVNKTAPYQAAGDSLYVFLGANLIESQSNEAGAAQAMRFHFEMSRTSHIQEVPELSDSIQDVVRDLEILNGAFARCFFDIRFAVQRGQLDNTSIIHPMLEIEFDVKASHIKMSGGRFDIVTPKPMTRLTWFSNDDSIIVVNVMGTSECTVGDRHLVDATIAAEAVFGSFFFCARTPAGTGS